MSKTLLALCDPQHSLLRVGRETMAYTAHGHLNSPPRGLPGFCGAYREARTGHYLLGNGYRAYNPVLMRFHRPDSDSPFAGGGVNAYAYCLGDPVNRRDPSGHLSVFGILAVLDVGLTVMTLAAAAAAPDDDGQDWLFTAGTILGAVTLGGGVLGGVFKKLDDFWTLSYQSMTRRGSLKNVASEGRALIQDTLAGLTHPSPFTRALQTVNGNLISHANTSLSPAHARKYLDIAKKADEGTLSTVSAHTEAVGAWFRKGDTDGTVGMLFNGVAAVYSGGAFDAPARKTGSAIRRGSH